MFKIILALLLMIVSTSVEAQFIFPSGGGGAATSVVVGTTTITGGTTTRILYDNAGVLGEYTLTGTGTVVAMQTSPSLTTPNINVATGTSLALGGATIGTDKLAVTGTSALSGQVTNALGTITTSKPFTITQTWNDGSVTFNSLLVSVTATASSATSLLMDLQVASASVFNVNKFGTAHSAVGLYNAAESIGFDLSSASGARVIGPTATLAVTTIAAQVRSADMIGWSSTTSSIGTVDTGLSRNAAGIIQFGTTAANASGSLMAVAGTFTGSVTASDAGIAISSAVTTQSGTAAPYFLSVNGSSNAGWAAASYGNNANGAEFQFFKTRAASTATTVVQSGDRIFELGGYGADSVAYRKAGGLRLMVDGTPGNADMPGRWEFLTTPDGSATPAVRWTIDNTGKLFNTAITLADQAQVLAITATQPATITGTQNAIAVTVTGAGSSSQVNYAHKLLYSAGYTGTSFNAALNVVNTNAGSLSSGLFVGLADTTPSVAAAMIVDNGAVALPIFLAMDNGTTVLSIANGGTLLLVAAPASDATKTTATLCRDTTSGEVYVGSGTVGICLGTSSLRFKNNIVDIKEGLSELTQLQPKRFWYNKDAGDNGAKEQVGFLAEDVAQVLPNLVGLDAEGRPNTLDMIGMIPMIIKAIQELKADNDNLRATLVRRAANGG